MPDVPLSLACHSRRPVRPPPPIPCERPSRSGHRSGSDSCEAPAESDVLERPSSDKERRWGNPRICRQLSLRPASDAFPRGLSRPPAGSAGKWLFRELPAGRRFPDRLRDGKNGESPRVPGFPEIPSRICHGLPIGRPRGARGPARESLTQACNRPNRSKKAKKRPLTQRVR